MNSTLENHQNPNDACLGGYHCDENNLNVSQTMSTDSKDSFDEEINNNADKQYPAQNCQLRQEMPDAETINPLTYENRTVTKSSLLTNNTSSFISIMGFDMKQRDRVSTQDDDSSSSNSGVHNYVNANAQSEIQSAKPAPQVCKEIITRSHFFFSR